MRAIVCGGGTGGHIYPALSIAELLREQGAELLYMGGKASTEQRLAADAGLAFAGVDACGLRRRSVLLLRDLAVNLRGLEQAKGQIRAFGPDVVIGSGGYGSFPVVAAAQQLGVPTVLHEQNAFPGLANRALSRRAQAVCLTFAAAGERLPKARRLVTTGLPVRQAILSATRAQAREYFQIDPADTAFTLLITGGSLGAASLNRAGRGAWQDLLEQGVRIIHLCGRDKYSELARFAPRHPRLILRPYLDQMQFALALADLAVARAGASFLAEACCLGLPTLLVPYPYAANDHQRGNALACVQAGAAELIPDGELTGRLLAERTLALAQDRPRLAAMAQGARALAKPQATEEIVQVIHSVLRS